MKKLLICFGLILSLSGCSSNKELAIEMQAYMDSNGKTLLKYVEADTTLIQRDKEPYFARHRTMQKLLDKELKQER